MRDRAYAGLAAGIAFAILSVGPLRAADAVLDRMIPSDRLSCFSREYDPDHLRRHPRQEVTSFRLDFYPSYAEDRGTERERFDFHVAVAARRPRARFTSLGGCYTDDGIFGCKLECDVGRFKLKGLPPDGLEIAMEGIALAGCGEASRLEGRADRALRLKRLPDAACRNPAQWDAIRPEFEAE